MEAKDLPLMSLSSSAFVQHYVIHLDCDVNRKTICGVVQVFLDPCAVSLDSVKGDFSLVLDLHDISIEKVEVVEVTSDEVDNMTVEEKMKLESCIEWFSRPIKNKLDFIVEEWCIKIKLLGNVNDRVLRIRYRTRPTGKSLLWIPDDDGNLCCLTAGSLINNRSLFPYQDAPHLMATWQLLVKIPEHFVIVTTGDDIDSLSEDGHLYFYTQVRLPLSTFALAIGRWKNQIVPLDLKPAGLSDRVTCRHSSYPCSYEKNDPGPGIPTRLFHSPSVNISSILTYLPHCYETVYDTLGRLLVPKMDIVILPKTVSFLGLTSPGLIFLSPSVLYGSMPMLERLGHEISHSWFGVHIGPKNWEEEWISEGFATFMEDVIDIKMSINQSPEFLKQWMALKALNRYEILKSDCQNIDSSTHCASTSSGEAIAVKNGLNSDRIVSQIPYIKGYFFLYRLSSIVGLDNFLLTLRRYVEHFHGTLLSTAECIEFFCCQHNDQRTLINEAAHTWLYSDQLTDFVIDPRNSLYQEITEHYKFWKKQIRKNSKANSSAIPKWPHSIAHADQLVSLFDKLLLLDCPVPENVVKLLINTYQPHLANATAYHRLCEIIVANRYRAGISLVHRFLVEHVAMGSYLYGELMISDVECFQNLARHVFGQLEPCLEHDFRELIREMLGMS